MIVTEFDGVSRTQVKMKANSEEICWHPIAWKLCWDCQRPTHTSRLPVPRHNQKEQTVLRHRGIKVLLRETQTSELCLVIPHSKR